jgi:cyclophilin family peptidyl-prolyl cis-trans isomerase/HEAT repeat protein
MRLFALALLFLFTSPLYAQTDNGLAALRQNLTHADANVRRQAVREIGRLERPDLIAALTRSLADDNVNVRIEAANAVGQLAQGAAGVADAKSRLLQRAKAEKEPRAWGAVAATLGRLAYTTAADVDQVEAALAPVLPTAKATAIQIDALLGATQGLEALARQSGKVSKLKPSTLNGLRAAAALQGREQDAEKLARVRRLATLALAAAGGVTRPNLDAGVKDTDAEVRRLTMIAARAEVEGGQAIAEQGLSDRHPQVRYEALQTWGRLFQKASCAPTVRAVRDNDIHVSLLAIDLLGNGCPGADQTEDARVRVTLRGLVGDLSLRGDWHRPAHAIVSLAKVAADAAAPLLPPFVAHQTWQVRMYAARAAGALAATSELQRLARDRHHNVREAALSELIALKRDEALAPALDALKASDYQLVMTAARAVAAAPPSEASIGALRQAYDRIAAERRDTSRDALNALRDAVSTLGGPALPEPEAGPLAAPRVTAEQIAELGRLRLRFTMAGRGMFELRLFPEEAPVTAQHIATLAREGYYNGLTFHRVVPNFVIQGGSPGANEYAGQAAFMRDEVGLLSHTRGTVGISTRGRHTGDAQIFINLVDLPRLDHIYTVFAEVVSGMDVVDRIVEGDVIERVEVVTAGS